MQRIAHPDTRHDQALLNIKRVRLAYQTNMPYGFRMAKISGPKALHIESFPADLRAAVDDEARKASFSMRVTIITLLREAIIARKAAA